jgi:D-alanyl-D-alanine dipeptidase
MFFKRRINFEGLPSIPPLGSVTGWKEVPIWECGERLVPLGPFSEYSRWVLQDSIYWGERGSSPYDLAALNGSLITPFVREGVAKRLVKAASLLPDGYRLLVWDAYRKLEVQQALFDYYVQVLEDQGLSNKQAIDDAQRFVSIPSTDSTRPSPHNTGAVADLTIVRFDGQAWEEMKELERSLQSNDWQTVFTAEMRRLQLLREQGTVLDMGTVFDEVSPRTVTAYYEQVPSAQLDVAERQRMENRRLLYHVMVKAGFSSYEEEWWHFSYGDQFWAVKREVSAVYGAANFSPDCKEWERMRRDHFLGCISLWEKKASTVTKLGGIQLLEFVRSVVKRTGNPRFSAHPRAATL